MARDALEPHAFGAGARLDLSGCEADARARDPDGAALAAAMTLHGLATKALKHGARLAPTGFPAPDSQGRGVVGSGTSRPRDDPGAGRARERR